MSNARPARLIIANLSYLTARPASVGQVAHATACALGSAIVAAAGALPLLSLPAAAIDVVYVVVYVVVVVVVELERCPTRQLAC